MRPLWVAFFIISLFLNCPFAIAEEKWEIYSSFMERFYYLDKQSFNNISCEIYVSPLNEMLADTKEQFKKIEDKIKISDNITDFRLNLNEEKGLTFIKPSLDVKIISEEEVKDRTKLDLGIEQVRLGFKMYVDGTIHALEGLFGMYIAPKKESLKINQILRNSNEFKVIYETDGYTYTDVYSGDHCVSEEVSNSKNIKILVKSEFTKVDDKFIVKIADIHIDDSGSIQDATMTIDYQKINAIVFPSKIVSQSKIRLPAGHMEGRMEIFLKNCKVD